MTLEKIKINKNIADRRTKGMERNKFVAPAPRDSRDSNTLPLVAST
jgi:hypothetical protein